MKRISYFFCFSIIFSLNSCIGEDVIDDFVEPSIRIGNPIGGLKINETHNYEAIYFNNVGVESSTTVNWSSSNTNIVSISNDGLATAISEGQATITATVTNENTTITDTELITIVAADEEPPAPVITNKGGTIKTTSSYTLKGDFTIEEIGNNLKLSIASNYQASSALPGLYLYLTNNPNSVNNALIVAEVTVFSGEHEYEIPNTKIGDYKYLLYWCKPFSVKVGEAEIK